MKIFTLLGIIFICAGCVSKSRRPHEYWEQQLTEIAPAYHEQISLIQLIANPQAFKDRYVRVAGYLNMEFERDKLFLHKIDRDERLDSNGVSIGICSADSVKKLRALSDHYVFIEGKVWCERVWSPSGISHEWRDRAFQRSFRSQLKIPERAGDKPLVTTAMTQTPSTTSLAPLSHL